jgi:hypothetical protein
MKAQTAVCLQRERRPDRVLVYDGSVDGTYHRYWCRWMELGGDKR